MGARGGTQSTENHTVPSVNHSPKPLVNAVHKDIFWPKKRDLLCLEQFSLVWRTPRKTVFSCHRLNGYTYVHGH